MNHGSTYSDVINTLCNLIFIDEDDTLKCNSWIVLEDQESENYNELESYLYHLSTFDIIGDDSLIIKKIFDDDKFCNLYAKFEDNNLVLSVDDKYISFSNFKIDNIKYNYYDVALCKYDIIKNHRECMNLLKEFNTKFKHISTHWR